MASVTQRIQHYVGGVSKQPDDKKFPGQVREALNAYPDPTFGLQKRPGLKFLTALKDSNGNAITGTTLDAAKWFYIHRNNDEKYIGCIAGAAASPFGEVHVWNATTNVKAAITYGPTARDYLTAITKDDYHVLTVQDTSIITNKQKTVLIKPNVSRTKNLNATIRLHGIEYSSPYTIKIKVGNNAVQTFNRPTYAADAFSSNTATDPKLNADHILGNTSTIDGTQGLKGLIEAKISAGGDGFDSNMSVTMTASTLEIVHNTAFTVTVEAGTDGRRLTCFQEEVNNVSDLPDESIHHRAAKIVNTSNQNDTYFSRFIATDGISGPGYWEETLGWDDTHLLSTGLDLDTMPHELVNTGTDAFEFKRIEWTNRLVGDDSTNSHPSMKDAKIQQAFFYNNRLGFLTQDNVSMSQTGEFYNFYHISAQTVTAADPVDLSCSSIRPAVLHGIIPVASGLILFSENQQFLMYSADGNLSPTTAMIRGLSNYEMDTKIDPVDVGTVVNFISKTPAYTKVFGMTPRGEGQMPLIRDVGKVVAEYIPHTIDALIASPQNSFIAMFGSGDNKVYFYRTHSDGEKEVLQAWFNWELPGNVLELVVDSDVIYTIVKQSNGFQLLSANLSATPEDEILVTQSGIQLNPYMDFYAKAASVVYDSITDTSKCYLPYSNIPTLEPVIVIAGDSTSNDSGYTVIPSRGTDNTGDYFSVVGDDFSGIANKVIVGYTYNYDITLPKTYFQLEPGIADYTATLTIARMKFSVGRSSTIGFKIKSKGYKGSTESFFGDGTTVAFSPDYKVKDKRDIIVKKNGKIQELSTDYTIADHATLVDHVTVTFSTAPSASSSLANITTAADLIEIYEDNWYDIQPVQEANEYLADDVPMSDQNVFTVPIHQRTDNFTLRVFSDSPFPVSLTSMMWEGNYSPRFYRRS